LEAQLSVAVRCLQITQDFTFLTTKWWCVSDTKDKHAHKQTSTSHSTKMQTLSSWQVLDCHRYLTV